MKPMICITVILTAILSLSGAAFAGTLLLSDDFKSYDLRSDAFPVWLTHSGRWEVTAEGFQGTDCDGSFIAQGASTGRKVWTDYILSLKLKLVSMGSDWRDGPWIGFRFRDGGNGYTLGFYNRATVLHKVSNGKATSDETALAETETTITDNEWHEVQIIVFDNMISIILDEKAILRVTDSDLNDSPPIAAGGIVLSARKYQQSEGTTQVIFKDVTVEAIGEVSEDMKFTVEDFKKADIGLMDFLRMRQSQLPSSVPVQRKVLAFYYTWYGRPENHGNWIHWGEVNPEEHDISESTHYPAIGAYDSHDLNTIDHHIRLAKDHGVDAFICTWWGQGRFDDRAFEKVLERAKEKDFEATIYWEIAPGEGNTRIANAVDDLVYVLEKYSSHPAFLKLDGKPVIFVYGRVMGQVTMSEWPAIITLAQKRSGKDFLLIADGYQDGYARLFDGIHVYNICGWVQDKKVNELRDLSRESFTDAVAMARKRGRLSCITIIPGYDDTKIRAPGINAQRLGGETYRVLWEEAIAADPDWILITSWNEWHEGSEIEPSWEDGDKYIKMTGDYSARFKAASRTMTPAQLTTPGIAPERARKLRELYGNQVIAILPDFNGEAAFWLIDSGINLKGLTWQSVLDPEQFNVKNFPVLLYAGGEKYTQTVKEKGDVDEAILKYLGEGGLLISIASMPFPFYHNEAGEVVISAWTFGFAINGTGTSGWEIPPDDVELTFKIDNRILASLPISVPFPKMGDLRWRPNSGADFSSGDIYLPLAQLKDQNGNSYGDGIAYMEHKVVPPENGKNIYVWMRMLDVLNTDDVLYELFRLAGEKMTR